MSSLFQSFLKAINSGFKKFHRTSLTLPFVHERICYLEYEYRKRVRSTGDRTAVDGEPVLILKALRDRRRRQDEVHKQLPFLVQEIERAWTADLQGVTREEIRKQFQLLGQVEPKEFDDILKNTSDWDALSWAVQIIESRTHLAPETIKKYGQRSYHRRQRHSGSSTAAA